MYHYRRLILHVLLGLTLFVGVSSAAAATSKNRPGELTTTLLVTGLEELQGSTVGPGAALFGYGF